MKCFLYKHIHLNFIIKRIITKINSLKLLNIYIFIKFNKLFLDVMINIIEWPNLFNLTIINMLYTIYEDTFNGCFKFRLG